MSKSIKIPSDKGNPVIVVLNGKEYIYSAGATETVPDEVAALFEANASIKATQPRKAAGPWYAENLEEGAEASPVYADGDGNLKVVGGGGSGGGADVLICDFDIGSSDETCTATFADVQAAIAAGKHIISQAKAYLFPGVVVNCSYYVSEEDEGEDAVRFVFTYATPSTPSANVSYFYALYKASGITIGGF